MTPRKDIAGIRFGMLVAVRPEGYTHGTSRSLILWRFRCDCGNEVVRRYDSVKQAKYASSCGCVHQGQLTPWAVSIEQRAYRKFCTKGRYDGYEVEIPLEDWVSMVKSPCAYCGELPQERWVDNTSGPRWNANGVDRMDSSKGYLPGNVASCCPRCNSMKSNFPLDEFLNQVLKICAHQSAKRGV